MRTRVWWSDHVNEQDGYKYLCSIDPINVTAGHVSEVISRYAMSSNVQLMFDINAAVLYISEDEPEDSYNDHVNNMIAMFESEPVRILWFSRHKMTADQEADLTNIYGKVAITQVSESALSWKTVADYAKSNLADVIAAVLPPNILGDLVNNGGLPVIRAIANRVPTGKEVLNPATNTWETEYCFQHTGWEQVDEVKIITHRISK